MSTPKKPKAVKAWAIVSPKGEIIAVDLSDGRAFKRAAELTGFDLIGSNNLLVNGYRSLRVLITPIL